MSLLVLTPLLFFYSAPVEQNRVVTIRQPLVITQEKKSPAYYLYQQSQKINEDKIEKQTPTVFLSNENYQAPRTSESEPIAVTEMVLSRSEMLQYLSEQKKLETNLASQSSQRIGFQPRTLAVAEQPAQPVSDDGYKKVLQNVIDNKSTTYGALESSQQSQIKKWATVRGKFELRDGVGVVDHIIEIKRIEEGLVREQGQVDLKAGLYSIDVASPRGYLTAVIKDKNGTVIGEDRERIINLQSHGAYLEGPFIQVKHPEAMAVHPDVPNKGMTRSVTTPAISKTNKVTAEQKSGVAVTLFSNQNKLEQPTDEFNNISMHSSTVAHIVDESLKNKPIVTIRQTGDKTKTPIFTQKWISGLIEYVSDIQKIEFKSAQAPLIIGQVLVDGKPKAGAQVQIENHPGINAIYLDQFMIPNFKQTETSANGYFLFIGLEEDIYSVAAFVNNKIIAHQIFIGENEFVSFQTLQASSVPQMQIVRSFDAFSSEPIDAQAISSDTEQVLNIEGGSALINTNAVLGLSEYLVDPASTEYASFRYIQDARKDYVHLPQIKQAWLQQIQAARLININPQAGIIIGFVPNMEYEAYLVLDQYSKENIVYFDAHGAVSAGPVAGGGFIFFNVPKGAREVVLQQKNSDRVLSQVYHVEMDQVSIAHFIEN